MESAAAKAQKRKKNSRTIQASVALLLLSLLRFFAATRFFGFFFLRPVHALIHQAVDDARVRERRSVA
jgi:hypothetical protein